MAQATFSCPFGAIHLEDRRGTPQRRTPFAMTAYPRSPILRGPPIRLPRQLSQRRGWGSSLAQGTGGRARAPVPTAYPKVRLIFCRARCPIGPFSGGPVCRPYEIWETFRSFRRGRSQTGPRAAKGRPYGGNGPVALARQSQAQFLNRSNSTFCTPRAQWPGGNSDQPLRFCAPEGLHSSKG